MKNSLFSQVNRITPETQKALYDSLNRVKFAVTHGMQETLATVEHSLGDHLLELANHYGLCDASVNVKLAMMETMADAMLKKK